MLKEENIMKKINVIVDGTLYTDMVIAKVKVFNNKDVDIDFVSQFAGVTFSHMGDNKIEDRTAFYSLLLKDFESKTDVVIDEKAIEEICDSCAYASSYLVK
jgi:hypothetical protein